MGFFIRWLWSKLKFILLRVPTDLENDQDKTVITSIQSFWVTRPSRSDLGAIRARFWQACGAWRKFWGLEATMRQYRYEFICFRTGFCFVNTGCFFSMSKVICLWESLKIQNMSWDWCFHFTEIGPFWDLVSKKFHNHSVIIHLWRLWRCIIAKISKIHWKSMIKKHQYCFANISATKAWIFMKFYVVVNYYLVGLYFKFHKDLCINARARVVNACTRDKTYMHALKTCACASMHGSS